MRRILLFSDDQMNPNNQTSVTQSTGLDRNLVRYGSIFLLLVGTFGNLLSFTIFSKGVLRKSSTFRYLALLSLMDLLVLYSGLLDLFLIIENNGNFSIRMLHPITCRLHTFITYWSQHSSSWILSFISVDRAIATNCLKFARKFCTPRSADYIVGLILFSIGLLNCHELIFLRLQTPGGTLRQEQTTIMPRKRDLDTLLSICEKSPRYFLCLKNKRDLPIPNITTHLIAVRTKIPLKQCEPPKGSNYEYFWDHVSRDCLCVFDLH